MAIVDKTIIADAAGDVLAISGSGEASVTGTVTANQGGTWNVNNIAGTVSLPTGAATGTKQDSQTALLTTIDADTSNISTKIDTVAGAVSGTEMQVDIVTIPTVTVQATNLDVRDLVAATDAITVHGDLGAVDQLNLANSDPLTVAIVDAAGDQITSFGGGVQYTEGDTDASITGTALLWEDAANTLTTASAAKPLPVNIISGSSAGTEYTEGDVDASLTGVVSMMEGAGNAVVPLQGTAADGLLVNLGANNDVTVTGTVTANAGTNLNTSALALETTASAIKTAVEILDNTVSGSEMQVDIVASLPAGTNNIGDVDVLTLPSLPAGTNNIGDVDVLTMPGTAGEGAALPSSFVVIAGDDGTDTQPIQLSAGGDLKITLDSEVVAASQSGTWNITNVSGTVSLPTGASTLAEQQSQTTHLSTIAGDTTSIQTAVELLDDTVYTDGTGTVTKGIAILGQDGTNPQAIKTDSDGELQIDILTLPSIPAGTNNIGDVDIASITAGDNLIGRVKLSDGTDVADILDLANSNPLTVAIVDASGDQITSFGGGTQYTEGATDASITGTAMLWEDAADTLTSVSAAKPLPVNIVSGSTAGTEYTEGDTDASITGTAIMMEVAANTLQPVQGTVADGLLVNLGSNNDVTVTGSVTANAGTNLNTSALALETTLGDVKTAVEVIDNFISGSRGLVTEDNSAAIKTAAELIDDAIVADDAAFTPATTKVMMAGFEFDDTGTDSVDEGDAGAARMSANRNIYTQIRDAAGNERGVNVNASNQLSVSVDNTVTVASHAVTNAGTFAVQVDGAALTALQLIDDPVAVLGTATYSEDTTKGMVIGAVRRDADTTLVDTTNEIAPLQVDANGRLKVEVFSGETLPVSGTVAVTQSGTWDEVGINDSGNSITVDAPIGTPVNVQVGNGTLAAGVVDETGSSAVDALAVGGATPHDSVDSGNPVKIGYKALSALPTPVASADRANGISDLTGRQLVAHIDPAMQMTKAVNVTTTQTGSDVWDPDSGKKIAVTSVVIASYGTTAARVILWFGDNADTTYSAGTDQVLLAASFAPSATAKPGLVFCPAVPVVCNTADRELHLTTDAGISLDITITGYEFS